MSCDKLSKIGVRAEVFLEYEGKRIVDRKLALILRFIEETGSLLTASRIVGVSYSRAWNWIANLEKVLGEKIINPYRGGVGGGGSRLTELGKEILKTYFEYEKILLGSTPKIEAREIIRPKLAIMGSHDILLEHIVGLLRKKEGLEDIEVAWIGSTGGLASLMLSEADIAGTHLYDEKTGEYNTPFLGRYWLEKRVIVYRGYVREIGWVYRRDTVFDLGKLFSGELRFINRNLGSGTRVLLDNVLRREASRLGISFEEIPEKVKGYNREVNTHYEVCRSIIEGKADIGVALRYVADIYGLEFRTITWENYDFIVRKDSLHRDETKIFLKYITRGKLSTTVASMPGYKLSENSGQIIYQ